MIAVWPELDFTAHTDKGAQSQFVSERPTLPMHGLQACYSQSN